MANWVSFHNTPLGAAYLNARAKAAGARRREAVEIDIFNHLYAFFSRYYEDGDFISKRRYAKHQQYAIPYNGEEVHLHWANRDQYYVKTGEPLPRLRLESTQRHRSAVQDQGRRCGAEQRQGRQAIFPAPRR